mmetsp:Transcript_45441/g.98967  ORF Transcript_45441/g.98967 Transcript_45441/m.98967 type:complete len:208 (+) Transcript_45441:120-743(+)
MARCAQCGPQVLAAFLLRRQAVPLRHPYNGRPVAHGLQVPHLLHRAAEHEAEAVATVPQLLCLRRALSSSDGDVPTQLLLGLDANESHRWIVRPRAQALLRIAGDKLHMVDLTRVARDEVKTLCLRRLPQCQVCRRLQEGGPLLVLLLVPLLRRVHLEKGLHGLVLCKPVLQSRWAVEDGAEMYVEGVDQVLRVKGCKVAGAGLRAN